MASIQINSIIPFDATAAHTITFNYSGAQCVKNKLVIVDSASGTKVFDDTVTTFALSHTVPAGTLTNGNYYSCTITAYALDDETGITSSPVNFRCLTTPTLEFDGIESGDTVASPNMEVHLSYYQAEGDLLNEYQVMLLSSSNVEIYNTGALYDQSLTVTLYDLVDGESYYLRAVGVTVSGMAVDSGNIAIVVHYEKSFSSNALKLINNSSKGYVEIISNIIGVGGIAENDVVFVSDGTQADLRDTKVDFVGGYSFSKEFEMHAFLRSPALLYNSIIPRPYYQEKRYGRVYSANGLTFTLNDDGSVTANGTARANTNYYFTGATTKAIVPVMEVSHYDTYKLTGCPAGGSAETYELYVRGTPDGTTPTTTSGTVYRDVGGGVTMSGCRYACVAAYIRAGTTVENITFRPKFVSVSGTLLPDPYWREAYSGDPYTANGITWTLGDGGSITANGTATANTSYSISGSQVTNAVPCIIINPSKLYTLSGCPSGGSDNTYVLRVRATPDGSVPQTDSGGTIYTDEGNGISFTGARYAYVYARIANGYAASNVAFHPVLAEVRPLSNDPIVTFSDDNGSIYNVYMRSNSNEIPRYLWVEVRKEMSSGVIATYMSEQIAYPSDDTPLYVYVALKDNRFNVHLEVVT